MNGQLGAPAPVELWRDDDTDCPVCGLGSAFAAALHYDTCARCGWVDDSQAYADPERRSETNGESLREAQASWPKRLVVRLADAPLSTFGVAMRDDAIGGYDYLADGVSLRELFSTGVWELKAAIGPWPAQRDWFAPLISGTAETRTGRTRLYVCHLCGGDDSEATLTADVHADAERVIWSRIGLETCEVSAEASDRWHLDVRRGPPGFAFDAREYRRALSESRAARR